MCTVPDFTEVHPRQIDRLGPKRYKAVRRFVCIDAAVESLTNSLYATDYDAWYGMGKFAPKCRYAGTQSGFVPGRTLVTGYYETPRIPGEVELRPATAYELRKVLREPIESGKIIEGPDPNDAMQRHVYKLVRGDNRIPHGTASMVMEAASETLNMIPILDRIGRVNASRMADAAGAASAEKMMLMGVLNCEWIAAFDLWYLDYLFLYSGLEDTWNTQVHSQKGFWAIKKKPIVTPDFEIAADLAPRYIVEFVYGQLAGNEQDGYDIIGTSEEVRVIAKTTNFSALPGYPG